MSKYLNFHSHILASVDQEIKVYNRLVREEFILEWNSDHYFSIGVHPWFLPDNASNAIEILKGAIKHPKCLAIGECGIDRVTQASLDDQEHWFRLQAQMAEENNLPLIIHSVRTIPEIIQIRKEIKASSPWIIHDFHGNIEQLEQLIKHGFYLSIGPRILHVNKLQTLVSHIPLDRLFIETDESDTHIETMYKALELFLNIPLESLVDQVNQNFQNIINESVIE